MVVSSDEEVAWVFDKEQREEVVEDIAEDEAFVRVKDRKFEIGLFHFGLGVSNDFMSTSEIFRKKVKINTNKLSDGFNVNTNMAFSPFFININNNDIWGFGVSSGLDIIGVVDFSGRMLTFHEAKSAKSDIGAAVFADINVYGSFNYEDFKIKIKPAVYYPLIYATPDDFSFKYKNEKINGVDRTFLKMSLDMRVYTAYPVEDGFDITDILKNRDKFTSKPGIDFSVGAAYPLSDILELTDKYDFLDFDVAVDFVNIPLNPATMEDYMRLLVKVGSDDPIDFFNGLLDEDAEEIDMADYSDYSFDDYAKGKRKIYRPFKMLISANWRPFYRPDREDSAAMKKRKKEWVTFTPTLGFAVNPLFFQPVSFEGGVKSCLNLLNLFRISLDIGYHDRLWKQVLEFAVNVRIFEIDFGVGMQSAGFLKSWSGGGFSAGVGLKFGW